MLRTPRPLACAALLFLGPLGGCGEGDPVGPTPITELPRPLTAAEEAVVRGSNAFAFGLLREVRAAGPGQANTFLSPLSASMALGMAMNGAAGDTWTQMRDALGLDGMEEAEINEAYRDLIGLLLDLDPTVEAALANAVWTDLSLPPLSDEFASAMREYFGADARTLDFGDPATIDVLNDWVEGVTRGRIEDLFESIPRDAVMYLVNAVYFQADWRSRFERAQTTQAPFERADGDTVTVAMMRGTVGYRTLPSGSASGVELPYGGGAFAAVALLPPEGQSIDAFVGALDDVTWDAWMEQFDAAAEREDLERGGMIVRLPRFELEWESSLEPALRALGMVDAFDATLADLRRVTGSPDLFVTDVFQKTYVRVDEEGTEAAAATKAEIGVTSLPPEIAFDRPFLFALRERYSGAILFLGVIGDP